MGSVSERSIFNPVPKFGWDFDLTKFLLGTDRYSGNHAFLSVPCQRDKLVSRFDGFTLTSLARCFKT